MSESKSTIAATNTKPNTSAAPRKSVLPAGPKSADLDELDDIYKE